MLKTNEIIGLGNALMDLLIEVDDNKLIEFNLKKGEMHLVEEEQAKQTLEKIHQHQLQIETVPGGSSANTLKAFSFLGGKALLCGKVGTDPHGDIYIQEMQNLGVGTRISKHNSITGHALTLITPDTERTFSVHLGAAIQLAKEDVLEEDIANSKILHLEGYQLEGPTKETVLHAIQLAKKHNTLVSIDLADPALIRRNKDLFKELTKDIDIIFLNEEEAKEFTQLEPEEALKEIAKSVKIVIVKLGIKGSLIYNNNQITKIDSVKAEAVDTTGAGDTFAAGFLYGFCQEWDMKKSGKLGSMLAAKVVEQIGVKINLLNLDEIKSYVLD
jgi:sugar/nucleoside kinase (ribokinase family)